MSRNKYGLFIPFTISLILYGVYFALSDTFGYDTITRSLMGARWLQHPFYISGSNAITWTFGPLHCYLNALSIIIFKDPNWGPRLFSTLFGFMTIFPLYFIVKEIFGQKEAFYSSLPFPFFTLYMNLSVSGNSESLSGFFLLSSIFFAILFSKTPKFSYSLFAGLAMMLSCATRYEVWLFIPIIGLFLFKNYLISKDRRFLQGCLLFVALSVAFPVSWILGNYYQNGNLLGFIPREDHDAVIMMHGSSRIFDSLYKLAYLPAVLFLSLSPMIFLIAVWGFWQHKKNIISNLVAWGFLTYLTYYLAAFVVLRTSILAARHINLPGLFLLVFLGPGLVALEERFQKRKIGISKITILATMLVLQAVLIPFNKPSEGWAERLRAISPVVQEPDYVNGAVSSLTNSATKGSSIFLDAKHYDQRILYLRLYKYWDNIEAYYGSPDSFVTAVIESDRDILVISPANVRLRKVIHQTGDYLVFEWPDYAYCKMEQFGIFSYYRRCISSGENR